MNAMEIRGVCRLAEVSKGFRWRCADQVGDRAISSVDRAISSVDNTADDEGY
ncbi:hypothetical protein DEO72_LG5g2452 [Vigna unguiculata]|uniref:Uncharacterized protein n=1 Tax=Vigna unguiculata TaxID=3917 RepID=A0A4D6LZF8_VIGUN|nr:hypothetical protein DEO72_LG5g2452 [Vigna unguiculata]